MCQTLAQVSLGMLFFSPNSGYYKFSELGTAGVIGAGLGGGGGGGGMGGGGMSGGMGGGMASGMAGMASPGGAPTCG